MRNLAQFWRRQTPTARGIFFMVLSTIGFALSHVVIRHLSADIHPIQTAFFHNFFGLAVFIPWLMKHGMSGLRTKNFPLHFLRAILNVTAMFCYFMALSISSLPLITAVFFISPIFTALFSVLLLGERIHARRWAALGAGFAGTLVILRPGYQDLDFGAILVLASAVLWAGATIIIRIVGRTDSSMTTTVYMGLLMTLFSLVPALVVWRDPAPETWGWLWVVAILGTGAHLSIAQALREAQASVVIPFDFLKLIWISILAYLVFAQTAGLSIWIGAAIVISATSYLAYREAKAKN